MTRIHILSPGFTNPNSSAFLFPFLAFQQALKDTGLVIKIYHHPCPALANCDVLLIEHKAIMENWHPEKSLEMLSNLKDQTCLIWCDQSDSTGTFLGQILPYVHKYLKAQILRPVENYKSTYYAHRIYADYYHKHYGIEDSVGYEYLPATSEQISKIGLSWNSGLMNHGPYGPYLNKILKHLPLKNLARFAHVLGTPSSSRLLDIACRMGISYPRATVRYQRERMREILKNHIPTDKISRRAYFRELKTAKLCASPFGYGEITLKDFEVFLSGSALLKPDMGHMQTWPDFYEADKTYISHKWDLSNLENQIETYLFDDKKREEIASHGQKRYLKYTLSPEAPTLFVEHFKELLKL